MTTKQRAILRSAEFVAFRTLTDEQLDALQAKIDRRVERAHADAKRADAFRTML